MRDLLDVRGMVRSPSGCSEVSSVRSFGIRGGGTGAGTGRGVSMSGLTHHQSGQCYVGFALPLDLDLLLYDASSDKKSHPEGVGMTVAITNGTTGKDRFPAITESEFESLSEENSSGRKGECCQTFECSEKWQLLTTLLYVVDDDIFCIISH